MEATVSVPQGKEPDQGARFFKHVLFGRVRQGGSYWEAFRGMWPSVASVLEAIKKDDHGTSARACQRIESRLMIDGVVEHFRRHHPSQPIQTIHDSVLVMPEAVDIARQAILTQFAVIGLVPSIEEKAFSDKEKTRRTQETTQAQADT